MTSLDAMPAFLINFSVHDEERVWLCCRGRVCASFSLSVPKAFNAMMPYRTAVPIIGSCAVADPGEGPGEAPPPPTPLR